MIRVYEQFAVSQVSNELPCAASHLTLEHTAPVDIVASAQYVQLRSPGFLHKLPAALQLKACAIFGWSCVQAAMPVIAGRKSKLESFAGANITYTIEAMMGDKKALQVSLTGAVLLISPIVWPSVHCSARQAYDNANSQHGCAVRLCAISCADGLDMGTKRLAALCCPVMCAGVRGGVAAAVRHQPQPG
jgi:hypothetical protein